MPPANAAPEFRDWSIAAVRLLQGVVYSEDEKAWTVLLGSRNIVEQYLARIGLALVVDETEGYAYVRQWEDDERPEGYEPLPRLVRRSALGYAPTLAAVLLRDEFRRFEESDPSGERCMVDTDTLLEQWKPFFSSASDDVKLRRELVSALRKLEELAFVREVAGDPQSWEMRKSLKARLRASDLEELRSQLLAAALSRGIKTDAEERADA